MKQTIVRHFPVLALALLTASCATTKITNTWKKPGPPAGPYAKVLVVDISGQENVRRSVEDTFVAQLKAMGVTGIPCYTIAPDTEKVTKEQRTKLVKDSGADAALVIRLVKIENKTETSPGYVGPSYGMYNYWGDSWSGAYYPPTVYTYEVVDLEAKFFDAKTEDLLWAVSTETTDPGKIDKEIASYTSIILGALKKASLLATAPK